ncbi:hypothetical protein [Nostoc sp. NZL]|uniref:hypothetical protein n=1 Tax=Nostoc sp. NZL TaxID=2650612 RepID=UPI0018C5A8A3|nr:hypothetical protein [Nostoc sp. NZL]MBG1241027.1 hypothetical protein [Nostoc sp. NZL]
MSISRTVDDLVYQVQIYNIPLLPIQQPLTFLELKDAIQTSVDILYHLHEEEYRSYKDFQYAEAVKEFGISSEGVLSDKNLMLVPDALRWINQFRSNFLSRFSTYTITICGLDRMLEKTYKEFLQALKNTRYNSLVPNQEQQKQSLDKRKEEIKYYTLLRNKVFAHTSFAAPQGDLEDLQSASLAFYSGSGMRYAEDHVYMQIDYPFVKGNIQVELRIFKDFSNLIILHYNEWAKMFTEIFVQLPNVK